ncbi:MAG: HlyD family efflux transporter periplasmic adaptor subunit [Lachnospiraceae bacterium]|nr:HlyD family efflux transporter periplasmic adaptor subunit [Lachnospiraceae bacterium]
MKWIKKHKKLCIFLVIAIVLVFLIGKFVRSVQETAETMMSMLTRQETAAIERRSLVESVSATGSVTSAGSKSVTAEVTGVKTLSVPIQVGDMVKEGDLLCLLDTADLEENLANSELSLSVAQRRTQLDLESAQRNLTEAGISVQVDLSRMEEQVASALRTYEEARESMNKAGSSYGNANNNSTEIRKALEGYQAQLAQVNEQRDTVSGGDASDSEELEAQAESLKNLIDEYQRKYSTAQETERNLKSVYDQAVSAVNNAYDAYERQLQNQEDAIRNGGSTLLSRQDNVTSSRLNASTSGLSDQQQIDRYQEQIAACTVTAPLSGVVTAVNLEVGDKYNGGAIVTIEDISSYEVTVEIDEYDISKIKTGQRVVIKTNGTGDLELEGKVISIAPRATVGSGVTYTVKTSIETPCEDLRMDMTAKLSIIISSRENVLTVPYAAVQTAEDGSFYVEVVDENGGAADGPGGEAPAEGEPPTGQPRGSAAMPNALQTRRIPVIKGIESDYYVEISGEGIEEGLEVIVPKDNSLDSLNDLMMQMGPMGGF